MICKIMQSPYLLTAMLFVKETLPFFWDHVFVALIWSLVQPAFSNRGFCAVDIIMAGMAPLAAGYQVPADFGKWEK